MSHPHVHTKTSKAFAALAALLVISVSCSKQAVSAQQGTEGAAADDGTRTERQQQQGAQIAQNTAPAKKPNTISSGQAPQEEKHVRNIASVQSCTCLRVIVKSC